MSELKPIYAVVICPIHGNMPLTEAEYEKQLLAANVSWHCPSCGATAEFDDSAFEDIHGLNESDSLGADDDQPF